MDELTWGTWIFRNTIEYVIDTKALSFFKDETFWYLSAFCCVDFFIHLKFTEDYKDLLFIKIILPFFFFTILGVKTEKFNILTHLKIPIRGAQLGALWWPTGMGWELGSGGRSIRRGYVYIHSWLLKIHVKNQQENGENINKKITHAYVNSLFFMRNNYVKRLRKMEDIENVK